MNFSVHPQRLAKDMIIEALGEGAVLAQYAGHGRANRLGT